MRPRCAIVAALLCLAVSGVEAGIHYLPERDVVWVVDFPRAHPCTPESLAAVDDARGWNKVAYDEAAQTCTVSCDLYIGRNDGSSTWFQVGSAERPTETLTVRGDLRVYSTWLAEENTESMYLGRQRTNRLTLGIPDDPSITASLLIDNEERAGHTIVIGGFSGYGSENQGGDLCAYHATIGPAGEVPVGQNERGANQMTFGGAGTVEVIDCVVRGIAGRAFGAQFTAGRFERTRFENCGVALHGNYQEIVRGCIFTGCGTGIIAGSRNVLMLNGCAFEGNERNWSIGYQHTILIDCSVDEWDRGSYSAEQQTWLVSKRHVVVKVVDVDGGPVEAARVTASLGADVPVPEGDLVLATTGEGGLTPGAGEGGALMLSELKIAAPEAEDGEPVRTDYVWTIEANKGDLIGRVENVTPRSSWQEIEITIAAEQ